MPEHIDPFDRFGPTAAADDDRPELARPRPGHPVVSRFRDRAEPWVVWFGLRRLVATIVVVVLVVAGGWWLLRAPGAPIEAGLPSAAGATGSPPTSAGPPPSGPPPITTAPPALVVHVAGAVVAPGVYEVDGAARTADALAAAGGPSPGADVDALNLAAPLRDGERVYVPMEGEAVPPPVAAPGAAAAGSLPSGPVDLNRATAAELDSLPGIGPATAAAIVTHRDVNGPFATVDDLEQVRGIGPAKLDAIRSLVTL